MKKTRERLMGAMSQPQRRRLRELVQEEVSREMRLCGDGDPDRREIRRAVKARVAQDAELHGFSSIFLALVLKFVVPFLINWFIDRWSDS